MKRREKCSKKYLHWSQISRNSNKIHLWFCFSYETSNGISQQETGQLTNPGQENESIAVRGQFSYTGADGILYTVTYIADDKGFRPEGSHLPQSK